MTSWSNFTILHPISTYASHYTGTGTSVNVCGNAVPKNDPIFLLSSMHFLWETTMCPDFTTLCFWMTPSLVGSVDFWWARSIVRCHLIIPPFSKKKYMKQLKFADAAVATTNTVKKKAFSWIARFYSCVECVLLIISKGRAGISRLQPCEEWFELALSLLLPKHSWAHFTAFYCPKSHIF